MRQLNQAAAEWVSSAGIASAIETWRYRPVISTNARGAQFDGAISAIVINRLTVTDPAVVAESHRWAGGQRGEVVGDDAMADADLSAYVSQALAVGAHAIGSAGGIQDTFNLEGLVNDVGTRTAAAAAAAAATTGDVVVKAAAALERASTEARKAITDAGMVARKSFSDNVDGAKKALADEINRLLGGENPELLDRITPLLATFSTNLNDRVGRQTTELIANAARQFDPSDPTSPMAKHNAGLKEQQTLLTMTLQQNHRALEAKVEELTTAMKVARAADDAAARTARLTPLKGETYAQGIHRVMREIATGLGDEYTDTGAQHGVIPRCKKGDGVLAIAGGVANLVLEMTDSARPGWSDYLSEAERNRLAAASLGLVPTVELNGGHGIRCLGQRRIVLAFDPQTDDMELLRSVVQVLRLGAVSVNSRQDAAEIDTAQEKIAEAVAMLTKIDEVKKFAGLIKANAGKIELESDLVRTNLERVLTQAQTALLGPGGSDSAITAA